MSKERTSWFAITAAAGLAISLVHAGTVVAQPPSRGPGDPGRGGPPNVAELFERMDKNKDGKLTKDEVPEPMWNHLSHADANHDGGVTKDEAAKGMSDRRPDGARPEHGRTQGGRPEASSSDRPRQEPSRDRGPRPPMEQPRGESNRAPERSPRDARPDQDRPTPSRSPSQPDRRESDRPDNAHRGPSPFNPEAFFDRLDKNHDGQLSRDEFKAVAAFHQGPQSSHGPQGDSRQRGPDGPPTAHRGPDMRGGGPPWAKGNRGNVHGPQQFHGGPPWARAWHGPSFHGKFAGPPWAHADQQRRGPHGNDKHADRGHKPDRKHKSDRKSSHHGGRDHSDRAKHDKAKGHGDHGRKSEKGDRSDRDHRRPHHDDRTSVEQPHAELMVSDIPSASHSDRSVATLPL